MTTGLNFKDCTIRQEALIGKINDGFRIAMYALVAGRCMAAMGLGIAEIALEAAGKYANTRTAFGKPLSALYAVQEILANLYVKVQAGRLLVYDAAEKRSRGVDYTMESSVAKLFIADAVNESCHKALQIFGGHGYMKYNDIERYARDGRLLDIGVGTSEVLKMVVGVQWRNRWPRCLIHARRRGERLARHFRLIPGRRSTALSDAAAPIR